MQLNTHIIKDWRAPGGTMECVTTYKRESDGSLYVSDVNGLPADALAPWLVDNLLELETEKREQEWESRADESWMQYQRARWEGHTRQTFSEWARV